MRPLWAEVSLSALRHNFEVLRTRLRSRSEICAVVKADAYGHGAVDCARALESAGASWFGVTSAQEGMRLRDGRIRGRVLVMTGIWDGEEHDVVEGDLTPAIWDASHVEKLQAAGARLGKRVAVHLKVNTGMTRLGADPHELPRLLQRIAASRNLELEGVFTHLASSEVLDSPSVNAQLAEFDAAMETVRVHGFSPRYLHVANTAAIFNRTHAWKTMVRPGLALYGYLLPFATTDGNLHESPDSADLKPVLSWRTRIISLRSVPAGTAVGYNGRYVTSGNALIAAVPIGYADGLSRQLSCRGRMIVRDIYAPIAGNVAMDLTMLDVTDVPGVSVGDEVIVIGSSERCSITAWEHARLANTVPYEILCAVSKRVPRFYAE